MNTIHAGWPKARSMPQSMVVETKTPFSLENHCCMKLNTEIESWLVHVGGVLSLLFIIYFASAGPAYRLCIRQVLPPKTLQLYRPIASIHSPLFPVTFKYVILWM